jgi:hypothetical protein
VADSPDSSAYIYVLRLREQHLHNSIIFIFILVYPDFLFLYHRIFQWIKVNIVIYNVCLKA